jgi:hypothetical protein
VTIGRAAASAWLLAVLVVALLEQRGTLAPASEWASSPAGVAAGRLWPLFTSGFVVAGPVAVQLMLAAVVTWLVVARLGARVFWLAAAAGHFGATLVAYAGIGALWLVRPEDARELVVAPDYGISCVWLANAGALVAAASRRGPRPGLAGAAFAGVMVGLGLAAALDGDLANVEHLLAFAAGGAVVAVPKPAHRALTRPA